MKTNTLAISSFLLSAMSSSSSSIVVAFSPSKPSLIHHRSTQTQLFQEVETAAAAAPATTEQPKIDNTPDWEVKQHLYVTDTSSSSSAASVIVGADGSELTSTSSEEKALPLPDTYITCGKCKSLFAIAETDLGTQGKGCRVKCTVCSNSWYQSRDRLLKIPADSHDMLPQSQSNLDRIARNLSKDLDPAYMGVSKLYVGNLDFKTDSDTLKSFFESNGCEQVCDVSVISGPDGRSRGFAFVSFYDVEDGKRGLECNGRECNGRELAVREPNN